MLLYLYLHPIIPLHLARARSDRPLGHPPRLPAFTACLRFPPMLDSPMSSSHDTVSYFPHPVAPPFPPSTCPIISLSSPGFSRTGVPSSLCLPPPSASPPRPPAGLNRRPIPLPVLVGGVVFFVPPSPVHPPRPPCVPRRLLVLSEV